MALLRLQCPVEAAFAGDHHPLGDVAQHGVARALEGPPRARAAGGPALPPHHLAPKEQAEALEDLGDVAREGAVGAPAEVGHVDRDASARFENPSALLEDVAQEGQVLEVGRRCPVLAEALLVLLACEVGRGRDDEGDGVRLDHAHEAGVVRVDDVEALRTDHGGVGGQLRSHEPLVEGGRVVALAAGRPETGGRCRSPETGNSRLRKGGGHDDESVSGEWSRRK